MSLIHHFGCCHAALKGFTNNQIIQCVPNVHFSSAQQVVVLCGGALTFAFDSLTQSSSKFASIHVLIASYDALVLVSATIRDTELSETSFLKLHTSLSQKYTEKCSFLHNTQSTQKSALPSFRAMPCTAPPLVPTTETKCLAAATNTPSEGWNRPCLFLHT